MADSRDWEKRTGSAPEGGTETTKTTITTERFRSGEEERRHTVDPTRSGAEERRRSPEEGVKSYGAEYASGTRGDEPSGATVRGGEQMGGGRYGGEKETSRARGEGSEYRERASEAGAQVKEKTARMAEEARQRGKGFLEEQKRTAADSLERFASILHETGERLEDDQPTFSDFFHRGADSIDRFAGVLRERDTESMLNQFQDFARRQPGLVLGGAVAAGFFLSRVLKSSSHRPESAYAEHRFRRSGEEREFFDTSERMRAYREVGQDVPTTTMEEYHGRE